MIQFDQYIWVTHDPDGVLTNNFDLHTLKNREEVFKRGEIYPREDLMQFTHKASKICIDHGYYGCEVKLNGRWTVYVIDGNLEADAWNTPLERHDFTFDNFIKSIECVQKLLNIYK